MVIKAPSVINKIKTCDAWSRTGGTYYMDSYIPLHTPGTYCRMSNVEWAIGPFVFGHGAKLETPRRILNKTNWLPYAQDRCAHTTRDSSRWLCVRKYYVELVVPVTACYEQQVIYCWGAYYTLATMKTIDRTDTQ